LIWLAVAIFGLALIYDIYYNLTLDLNKRK
jgi:hypothetical protein